MTACEFPLKNGEISIIGVKRFDRAAFAQEDLDEGVIQLREAIRLDPRSVSLRQELAMTMIWDGRYDDAMAESRAIATIEPNRAMGILSRAASSASASWIARSHCSRRRPNEYRVHL